MEANAVRINTRDNVAVAVMDIKCGDPVTGIPGLALRAREDIKRNHKVALTEIRDNAPVIKYGETIGLASGNIQEGEWVHTHNLKTVGA